MGLQDKEFGVGYSTLNNDILNDFFLPCLDCSIRYDRISAYFSSRVFIFLLDGLKQFIQNDGKIRLVLGVVPHKEIDIINTPKNELLDFYLKNIEFDLEEFPKISTEEHYKLLAWLIYNNRLEIKLAIINTKEYDDKVIERKIESSLGILHSKIGIFWDELGNGVSYSGSPNCSLQAWVYNYENIKVFNNWENVKSDYFVLDESEFESFWNEKKENFAIIKLPNENLKKIIKEAPKSLNDISFSVISEFNKAIKESHDQVKEDWIFEDGSIFPKLIDSINLRYYQNEAIYALKENKYCGILQMATGSGKTLTAIRATYELYLERFKEQKPLLTIIAGSICYFFSPPSFFEYMVIE